MKRERKQLKAIFLSKNNTGSTKNMANINSKYSVGFHRLERSDTTVTLLTCALGGRWLWRIKVREEIDQCIGTTEDLSLFTEHLIETWDTRESGIRTEAVLFCCDKRRMWTDGPDTLKNRTITLWILYQTLFGPTRDDVTGDWRKLYIEGSIIWTLY